MRRVKRRTCQREMPCAGSIFMGTVWKLPRSDPNPVRWPRYRQNEAGMIYYYFVQQGWNRETLILWPRPFELWQREGMRPSCILKLNENRRNSHESNTKRWFKQRVFTGNEHYWYCQRHQWRTCQSGMRCRVRRWSCGFAHDGGWRAHIEYFDIWQRRRKSSLPSYGIARVSTGD